jgi:hypothetical protein
LVLGVLGMLAMEMAQMVLTQYLALSLQMVVEEVVAIPMQGMLGVQVVAVLTQAWLLVLELLVKEVMVVLEVVVLIEEEAVVVVLLLWELPILVVVG